MIDSGQKVIFPARARQSGTQLTVTKRAAEGDEAAHNPKQHEHKSRMHFGELKPETGENTGTNDVRDHNCRGRREPDGSPFRGPPTLQGPGGLNNGN